MAETRGGLINLWLYKENKTLRDWKKCIYSTYSPPPSSTHLWLRCSNFFNPSKKNSFGWAANRKIGKARDLSALLRISGTGVRLQFGTHCVNASLPCHILSGKFYAKGYCFVSPWYITESPSDPTVLRTLSRPINPPRCSPYIQVH
jgi:hypothetical protein